MKSKKQFKQKNNKIYIIIAIELILFCMWGGFYDFVYALYGVVFSIILLVYFRKKTEISVNITTVGMILMTLGYLGTLITAEDKGMAVVGVVRISGLFVFWVLWCSLDSNYKETVWKCIPDTAVLMNLAALVMYFIPGMRDYFYRADRLGGFFQYSNTYALFLLVSVIVLMFDEQRKKSDDVKLVILISGIVFCGSRSVMVLSVIVIAGIMIGRKVFDLKHVMVIIGVIVLICLGMQFVLGLDISRLLKLSMNSSTLNGRFLYWQDAFSVFLKNPLGIGYMGYYYLQPQFQTGNYVTMFVHNDILQFGLDAGWLAAGALIAVFIGQIMNKHNGQRNRIILVVLALHSLFDFDLQFASMGCLMLMAMDTHVSVGTGRKWKNVPGALIFGVTAVISGYFALALGMSYFGENRMSLVLYPGYTTARTMIMTEDESGEQAERVIRDNGMLADAYKYAAVGHLNRGEYLEAYDDLKEMPGRNGYDAEKYDEYVYVLSKVLDQAVRSGDMQAAEAVLNDIREVPEILTEKEAAASDLAYKINDAPTLELSSQIQSYIERLQGISLY